MKTSDVIKRLKEDLKQNGDSYLRDFKYSDEFGTHGFHMVQRDKDGKLTERKMTVAQFKDWVEGKKSSMLTKMSPK